MSFRARAATLIVIGLEGITEMSCLSKRHSHTGHVYSNFVDRG